MTTGIRAFRWGWTAFVVFATSVPYLLNWLHTPTGFHYTWIIPPYPQDSLGYMAWSQQAAHGSLLFKIKYTALPQSAFLFHPFLDRKSTRLNSSHLVISYAVFCLKKHTP